MFYRETNLFTKNRNINLTILCITTDEPIEAHLLKVFMFKDVRVHAEIT